MFVYYKGYYDNEQGRGTHFNSLMKFKNLLRKKKKNASPVYMLSRKKPYYKTTAIKQYKKLIEFMIDVQERVSGRL